jgi:hypothetical protein
MSVNLTMWVKMGFMGVEDFIIPYRSVKTTAVCPRKQGHFEIRYL